MSLPTAQPGSEPLTQATPTQPMAEDVVLSRARGVLDIEIEALERIKTTMNGAFCEAVALIEGAKGRVVVTGMGKSGLVGRKIAATLSSTGTPSVFLHPAEGSHGDLGMITRQDLVLAISNSGETEELLGILPTIKRIGVPLIVMTGKETSTLAQRGDVMLDISVPQEACPMNLAPTASTTATLALGDALAVVLLERKGFTPEDFALFHPSGALGKRLLLTVSDLMHTGEALPRVSATTPFIEALMEITTKKLGMTLVEEASGELLGILTDGDIRRALTRMDDPKAISLVEAMTRNPLTISPDTMAVTALRMMEERKITVLVVVDSADRAVGVIHMHDILQTGIS